MLLERLGVPRVRGSGSFLVALAVDALGTGLYVPFALLYFTVAAGLPLRAVGLALSAATALTLPATPLAGALADRHGARRVVATALLLQGLGFIGYLFVGSVAALVGVALLATAGLRLFWAAFPTLVAEVAEAHERDRWFGLAAAAQAGGNAAGALLAGLAVAVANASAYRGLVAANALSYLVGAALIARLPERHVAHDAAHAHGGYRAILRDRAFLVFVASNVAFALCDITIFVGLAIALTRGLDAPGWVAGAALTLSTALLVLAQTTVVRLAEPHRRTRALLLAGVIWAGAYGGLALAGALPHALLVPWVLLVVVVDSAAVLLHGPTANALAAAAGPEALRGRYVALFQLSWGIASAAAPAAFALLYDVRAALPWLAVGALALLGALAVAWAEPRLPAAATRAVPEHAEREALPTP